MTIALSIWTYKKTWSSRCNFFQKCQKNYKCWIKCISKKFTTTGSANTCNFFWKWKNFDFKKNTTMGFKWCFDPIVVIFFEIKNFSFPKKITSVGWSSRCNFFWNALDPTLVIFLAFLKQITTTGLSLFICSYGQGYSIVQNNSGKHSSYLLHSIASLRLFFWSWNQVSIVYNNVMATLYLFSNVLHFHSQ